MLNRPEPDLGPLFQSAAIPRSNIVSLSLSLLRLNQFRRGITDPRRPCYCHNDKDHTCKEFELLATRNLGRFYEAVDCIDEAKKTLEQAKEDKKKAGMISIHKTTQDVKDAKTIVEWEEWFTEDDRYKNDLKPFCLYPADVKSLLTKPGVEILHMENPFLEVYLDLSEAKHGSNELSKARRVPEVKQEERALSFHPQSSGGSGELLNESEYAEPQERNTFMVS